MNTPDLTQVHIVDPATRERLSAGDQRGAMAHAQRNIDVVLKHAAGAVPLPTAVTRPLGDALADLAGVLIATGSGFDQSAALLQRAVGLAPESRHVFHNLAVLLYTNRQMHGDNYQSLVSLLLANAAAEWRDYYRAVLLLPNFLNLEFVTGKCNLKCRMCVGTNSASHPGKLTYMDADKFAAVLDAAPGVRALTLSSGDSDPLLHPQLERVLKIAAERGATLDIYTNGLPMGERIRKAMVESGAVSMLNVSIDGATAESYSRIRGGDLKRVHENIRQLQALKAAMGKHLPQLSVSFVAMADNVAELPEFVEQAREFGALRIFVGDLIGWRGEDGHGDGGNISATEHPQWREFVADARRIAAEARIHIELPERLSHSPVVASSNSCDEPKTAAASGARLRACGWLNGVWINRDGSLDPCCLVHGVADMGSAADSSLLRNNKYLRVKSLLAEGKVFEACRGQRMCPYVQQQEAAKTPLRIISREELGVLAPAAAKPEVLVSLPVLTAA